MFQEYRLNEEVVLKNRIVMAPMTTWSSNEDLTVSNDELEYYAARSNEVGMVITGCTFFQDNGQGFDNQFFAGNDEYLPSLTKLATTIKNKGAKAILQIVHCGNLPQLVLKQPTETVSASAVRPVAQVEGLAQLPMPRAMSKEEINTLIEDYYKTVKRAMKAGFDGVEIHGANNYLLQQFFSPAFNIREDEWGGTIEKRMNLIYKFIEVTNKAKNEENKKDFIIGYRFSVEEAMPEGITIDDTLYLVDKLSEQKIDYLHVSLNDYECSSRRNLSDKRVIGNLLTKKINGRKPLIGSGNIHTRETAEHALNHVGYDLVAIGHALVTDPEWVSKVEQNKEVVDYIDVKNIEAQKVPENLVRTMHINKGWFHLKE